MANATRPVKPPAWFLALFFLSIPAWFLGVWAQQQLLRQEHVGGHLPRRKPRPDQFCRIDLSDHRSTFGAQIQICFTAQAQAEAGFDDSGFWVRALGSGWFSGPGTPVFIPWEAVESCGILRMQISYPRFALII